MNIGLSVNTLHSATGVPQPDGIGVYTSMLLQGLRLLNQQIIPIMHKTSSCQDAFTHMQPYYFKLPFAVSGLAATFFNVATPGQARLRKFIDVYHCTDYHQPLLRHVPVVTTLHDAVFLQNPAWCRGRLRKLKNHVMRRAAERAEQVICVSHAAKHDVMQAFALAEDKISVIYHGVDDFWSRPVTSAYREMVLRNFAIKANYILYTGTIQPRKNVLRLLQAYQLLPQELRRLHQLVVVGKSGWDEPALQALQKMSATGEVKWLGYVTHAQLRCLYQASRVFVLPSLYEGFGLPILEAFASKTPVITAHNSALKEISADAAVLIDPYDVSSLCKAMERVLTNAQLREELVTRGEMRAQQFSWKTCVAETLKVYQRVL